MTKTYHVPPEHRRKRAIERLNKRGSARRGYAKRNQDDMNYMHPRLIGDIPYVDYDQITLEQFREWFEIPGRPCILRNAMNDWPAMWKWSPGNLEKAYGDVAFDGTRFADYHAYLKQCKTDSPAYIFDDNFLERQPALGYDFKMLKIFPESLVHYIPPKERDTPTEWFLIGGQRSGSAMHTDPLGTTAWNALVHGRKRWVLFPPGTPKHLIKNKRKAKSAVAWWEDIYPDLVAQNQKHNLGMIEFVQYPGEVVFLPGKWWHTVVNMDLTVCVTANFISSVNLPLVWGEMKKEAKKKARKFYRNLPPSYRAMLDLTGFDPNGKESDLSSSSATWSYSSYSSYSYSDSDSTDPPRIKKARRHSSYSDDSSYNSSSYS